MVNPEDYTGPGTGYIVTTWDAQREKWNFRPVIGGELLTADELAELELYVPAEPEPDAWAFPVGNDSYPPKAWYCASFHDPQGVNGYAHTGLDLNLDVSPWGDVERTLGLAVYSIADGIVEYVTDSWSGVGMCVIRYEHEGAPLWVRYAHIMVGVMSGQVVKAGQMIGPFADWKTGDHLHFDMARDSFTREWLTVGFRWVDPVPVLKAHLDPQRVDAMLDRG